jgi:hypothetical protein
MKLFEFSMLYLWYYHMSSEILVNFILGFYLDSLH